MRWFTNYGKVVSTGLVNEIQKMLVRIDPESATEADILLLEDNLDKLTKQASEQIREAQRERKEADEIVKEYNQRLAAIEILQADVKEETDQARIDIINETILSELTILEEMVPQIEQEKKEAEEAEEDLSVTKELATIAAKKLKEARANLEKAKKNLDRQKRNVEREEERLKRSEELKGLTTKVTQLNTALDVMTKEAQEMEAKAAAIKMKGELLGAGNDAKSDIMKEAMARATGKPVQTASTSDRLAALKNKTI